MIEGLIELVPRYGPFILALGTFLSCLALPVPSSLLMLSAGGFVASGDISAITAIGAAFIGAVLGDLTGFHIGQRGARILARLSGGPKRARLMARARTALRQRGTPAVFLSRWLFSPLGPYVNFAGGAAALPLMLFARAAIAGEAVWVLTYTGAGYLFAENLIWIGTVLSDVTGLLSALAVLAVCALWLRTALRHRHDRET
ncbi:MAG: DedA family protein [Pseudomonadota bacterium]|nr:DedA family protein [Pseudomonadota bacterium]